MTDLSGVERDTGALVPAGGDSVPDVPERHTDPLDTERGKARQTIRESLETGFSDARKAAPEERDRSGRFAAEGAKTPKKGKGAETAPEQPTGTPQAAAGETAPAPATEAAPADLPTPPPSLAKDKAALAEWSKAPALAKALVRREEEMARGVEQLKAAHAEVDSAIAPHAEAIRRHGHTPAQAVNQLFSWFQALAANPREAFPALAKSFGHDISAFSQREAAAQQVANAGNGQAQPQPGQVDQAAGVLDPQLQKFLEGMISKQVQGIVDPLGKSLSAAEQQLRQFQAMQAADSQAKTEQIITNWAKDKPHFEAVRVLMSQLIASGAVPLNAGQVDLDAAYDAAIHANKDVRARMQQDAAAKAATDAASRQETERKAQQTAADNARRASGSIAPGAPGRAGAPQSGKQKKGASVKDSLMAAIAEHRT